MCYIIVKKNNKNGCFVLNAQRGTNLANAIGILESKLDDKIEIAVISRIIAYEEYEPYHFVDSYEELYHKAKTL